MHLKSFLTLRPDIDATMIYSLDPFMRNNIRVLNLEYYQEFFWSNNDFEIYNFIISLFDDHVLNGLPKWYVEKGSPRGSHSVDYGE